MTPRMICTPERAVIHSDGTRHCAWCGDHIDPCDWCAGCRTYACTVHVRPRKRADAAFCDRSCRDAYHNDMRKARRDG